jgi:anti-anti-sigma regulatory factor
MTQSRIVLDEQLSIAQVATLYGTLRAVLAGGGSVTLDGSAVREIDTAVLQLLASFSRSSVALGVDCTWQGVSAALRRAATLIGLSDALQLPDPAPGGDHGDARH